MIHEGHLIYYGPAKFAKAYFESLGFEPIPRETTPDFLVSCCDSKAQNVRAGVDKRSVPLTAEDLAKRFKDSEAGRLNLQDVESYEKEYITPERRKRFWESSLAEKGAHVSKKSSYEISYFVSAFIYTPSTKLKTAVRCK